MLLASVCRPHLSDGAGVCEGGLAASSPVPVRAKLSSRPGAEMIPENSLRQRGGSSVGGEKRWGRRGDRLSGAGEEEEEGDGKMMH